MSANDVLSEHNLNFLLVTANVGTLFEDRKRIEDVWLNELSQVISQHQPHFIALHCQEVGGKDYKGSFAPINEFFKTLIGCDCLKNFNVARGFLDSDYDHVHKYTALGNLYLIHSSVKEAQIYNFKDKEYAEVDGKEIFSKDICSLPDVKKEKFQQDFFPDCKWSRKGYCRVKWKLYGKVMEFVNIHLFHDDSNFASLKCCPSSYADCRKRALKFVLKRLNKENPAHDKAFFLFGDFNFRLDAKSLVQSLCSDSRKQIVRSSNDDDEVIRITYREDENLTNGSSGGKSAENGEVKNGNIVAKFERKYFSIDQSLFQPFSSYKYLLSYDKELKAAKENLKEFSISFRPSYPFSEEVTRPNAYMTTRCPSWCDRILLSNASWNWLHAQKTTPKVTYDALGGSVCMGDHKPVYLAFTAACNDVETTSNNEKETSSASETNGNATHS